METTTGLTLPAPVLEGFARRALEEDLGGGDVTTDLLVPRDAVVRATLLAREAGVVCGLELASVVFRTVDADLEIDAHRADGDAVEAGEALMTVAGSARSVLSAERVALNYVGRLSGIATLTRRYVSAVAGTGARVLDTRKTTPGLRVLEKYAVRCGGGHNHRFGLSDGFMLKDNHRAALSRSGVALPEAVKRARSRLGPGVAVTVEVDEVEQVDEALEAGADSILLDNMGPDELRAAVTRVGGAALTEASGGITLDSIRSAAESGVDLISVGALTHSAPALDVALEFDWEK